MKKLLVPVDFSEVSIHATQFAIEFAEKEDAEVTLLNSIHFGFYTDYQFTSFTNTKTFVDEVLEASKKKMIDFISKFNTDVKFEIRIEDESLVTVVKDLTKHGEYDLVVIGTTGSSGIQEVLVGSNAEKIVRHAECPVIAVPTKTRLSEIKKVLVPIDIREVKSSFLNQIAMLQGNLGVSFEFLWVKTPHNVENEEMVSEELSKVIQAHGITDYEFAIERSIFPSDGILNRADEINANMIAMPTHARRGIAHWLSGSLTEDTVNHIKVPVWSFKIDKKEKPVALESVKAAKGKPEYKKIEILAY